MKDYHFEETIAEEKGTLDVVNEIGSVEIRGYNGRSILIDISAQHMEIDVTREGDAIFVHAHKDDSWTNLEGTLSRWFKGEHPKANITIQVPFDCETRAKTITGKLTIADLGAPVTARVITGKAKLENLNGPIYAKTITGNLQYKGTLPAVHHRFEAITGQVKLALSKEPNATFDARTTTGNISCEFPLAQQKESRHLTGGRISGKLGDGAGHIKARVVTGSLRLVSA